MHNWVLYECHMFLYLSSIVKLLTLTWDEMDGFGWFPVTSDTCSLLLFIGQLLIPEAC